MTAYLQYSTRSSFYTCLINVGYRPPIEQPGLPTTSGPGRHTPSWPTTCTTAHRGGPRMQRAALVRQSTRPTRSRMSGPTETSHLVTPAPAPHYAYTDHADRGRPPSRRAPRPAPPRRPTDVPVLANALYYVLPAMACFVARHDFLSWAISASSSISYYYCVWVRPSAPVLVCMYICIVQWTCGAHSAMHIFIVLYIVLTPVVNHTVVQSFAFFAFNSGFVPNFSFLFHLSALDYALVDLR